MTHDLSSREMREALASAASVEVDSPIVERLMKALDTKKLFRYHRDEPVSLLSTTGRVLIAIIEDPEMTQRAISVYLGCSETLVDKTVKSLVDAGVITKTKVNRRNIYKVNVDVVETHSDIQHFSAVIDALRDRAESKMGGKAEQTPWDVGDEAPF